MYNMKYKWNHRDWYRFARTSIRPGRGYDDDDDDGGYILGVRRVDGRVAHQLIDCFSILPALYTSIQVYYGFGRAIFQPLCYFRPPL